MPNIEQSMCAVYADIYYYQIYLYYNPEKERDYMALRWGVPPEQIDHLPEWNDKRLQFELNCTVRSICREALDVQDIGRNDVPNDEQMHRAYEYVVDQWEVGRGTAQDLVDKEPRLNEYTNPMQSYEAFEKVWYSMQKRRRDLSLNFFAIHTTPKNSD